jgi:hypothetical protein
VKKNVTQPGRVLGQNHKTLGKEMGLSESTTTESAFYRLREAFFGREIDNFLKR